MDSDLFYSVHVDWDLNDSVLVHFDNIGDFDVYVYIFLYFDDLGFANDDGYFDVHLFNDCLDYFLNDWLGN